MSKLEDRIEALWPGDKWALHPGASPGCEECFGWLDEGQEPTDHDFDMVDEGSIHFGACGGCGRDYGRYVYLYPAHAVTGEEVIHIDVCTDCLMYFANGDLPAEEDDDGQGP